MYLATKICSYTAISNPRFFLCGSFSGPVDGAVGLEFAAEQRKEGKALLLASQLKQIWALVHDGSSACWHLKDLLLLSLPCDHIELFFLHIA